MSFFDFVMQPNSTNEYVFDPQCPDFPRLMNAPTADVPNVTPAPGSGTTAYTRDYNQQTCFGFDIGKGLETLITAGHAAMALDADGQDYSWYI